MNKWIAEFDLEDGDTMPEHMDLNYMGAKIDFHCRPMWISCSKRQPKENGNYLAFYRASDKTTCMEFMMVDHFNAGGGWLHEENGGKANKKVIAWMPLPEPYKAESEVEE